MVYRFLLVAEINQLFTI